MAKDVIVMGGGVGGLSAAIYARLAGHEVCLLEASDVVGGKAAGIEVGGYRLDPGPSINLIFESRTKAIISTDGETPTKAISNPYKYERINST